MLIILITTIVATVAAYIIGHQVCEVCRIRKARRQAQLEARFERALKGYLAAKLKEREKDGEK